MKASVSKGGASLVSIASSPDFRVLREEERVLRHVHDNY